MPLLTLSLAAPVVLVGFLVFLLAGVLAQRSGFYRELVNKEIASPRFHAVDGLRGYLALGVLFHHVALYYWWYKDGVWGGPITPFGVFLGDGSVAFFFMITAFLFWNRATDADGRLNAHKFYLSRLRRLVPMYLVAAALLIITVLAVTGFRLEVSRFDLTHQVLAWLLFTIPGAPSINQFEQTLYVNSVFWTLTWEWKFYVLLPFIAVFAAPRYRWYAAALVAVCIWFFSKKQFEWFFFAGCLAAIVTRSPIIRAAAAGWIGSFAAVVCIVATIAYVPEVYSLAGAALLLVPFIIFAAGNTLFGLLTCRPARLLGLLSYSVYLLHNWVLFLLSKFVNRYVSIAALPESTYWILGAGVALATVMLSSISYRFIESPFLGSPTAVRLPLLFARPRWTRRIGA